MSFGSWGYTYISNTIIIVYKVQLPYISNMNFIKALEILSPPLYNIVIRKSVSGFSIHQARNVQYPVNCRNHDNRKGDPKCYLSSSIRIL